MSCDQVLKGRTFTLCHFELCADQYRAIPIAMKHNFHLEKVDQTYKPLNYFSYLLSNWCEQIFSFLPFLLRSVDLTCKTPLKQSLQLHVVMLSMSSRCQKSNPIANLWLRSNNSRHSYVNCLATTLCSESLTVMKVSFSLFKH